MNTSLGGAFSTGRQEHSSNKSPERLPGTHLFIADPPPFGTGSKRFNKNDVGGTDGPAYHVAYRDTMQPNRWATKGWTGIDDAIKQGRGTSTGKIYSSMAQPSGAPQAGATLQPLYATHPNETRLQELLNLQRRKLQQMPGPGTYEVAGWQPSRSHFRRQNISQLDGPFITPEGYTTTTTRSKEIDQTLRNPCDSGLAPGDYDGLINKDTVMRQAPSASIGTGARDGRTHHMKSMSVSRSIQHGIDWHVPVVVLVKETDEEKEEGRGNKGAASATGGGGGGGRFYGDTSPPRDSHQQQQPVRPPQPPPAVARAVRRPQANAPGDWDWAKLGHNYRNNWTTLHGGAYSQGDRTLMRRVPGQQMASGPLGAGATISNQPPSPPEGFSEDEDHYFSSIDPSSLPLDGVSDMMFPIPEENSGIYPDIGPAESPLWSPDVGTSRGSFPPIPTAGSTSFFSPPGSSSVAAGGAGGSSRGMAATASAGGGSRGTAATAGTSTAQPMSAPSRGLGFGVPPSSGGASSQMSMLSRREMERRDAASVAAAQVQSLSARRNEWQAKSEIVA